MEPTKPARLKWLWIILIIIAVLGAAFVAWYYLMGPGKKTETKTATSEGTTVTPAETAGEEESDGWLTYTNETYGYSIQYPSTLTYVEQDSTKDMYFQTSEDEASIADCASRPETDCPGSNQIHITADVNAGTTNDETGKTLAEMVTAREQGLFSDLTTATLGGQSAYEGIQSGLTTSYDLFTTYNGHTYDLYINCSAEDLATCKGEITSDQQKMIDSFSFL